MYRGWTQTDYKNKHYNINRSGYKMYREWKKQTNKQELHYKPKGATSCTEDGHKQTTKARTKIYTKIGQKVNEMDKNRLSKQALHYKPKWLQHIQ